MMSNNTFNLIAFCRRYYGRYEKEFTRKIEHEFCIYIFEKYRFENSPERVVKLVLCAQKIITSLGGVKVIKPAIECSAARMYRAYKWCSEPHANELLSMAVVFLKQKDKEKNNL